MTAEHLIIVGSAIERAAIALSRGEIPSEQADTRTVKPRLDVDPDTIVSRYRAFGDTLWQRLEAGLRDRSSPLTHPHPWFGPMRTKDWCWLIPAHSGIHLKQLRAIRIGLVHD